MGEQTGGKTGGRGGAELRGSVRVEPRGPFSLTAGIRFLEGFTPAAREAAGADSLEAAFALEGSWRTVGVSVAQDAAGTVRGRLFAERALGRAELSAATAQLTRILSLDVDGSGFAAVGERDPVIGALQRRYPGLRPVAFWSWYEAAAWSIIGQRTRMTQAAALKQRMAAELGETVVVNGGPQQAFPAPRVLAGLGSFPGLPAPKVERLRALGEAAAANRFDSAGLRALPREEALAALQELPGIGPFSAELILLRGAGDPDHAPLHEGRLADAVQHAYGLATRPTPDELERLSAGWAPYRTWVTLLLRVALDEASR
ncbi:hypothetical protein NVV95_05410 [Herbiconiux sp. CPCC 205716]|uniref:DNA-3-methyladenine glycosylase II n=1 Tax=Herbiconiux gentiana TaxID=2970912 RepID=A0ABT2GGR7_9MICO|nr:hypothetical protein [Herbiconiux gentiana]MCS5713986.1 hypothetical protein [Herbiconiux gentiana]